MEVVFQGSQNQEDKVTIFHEEKNYFGAFISTTRELVVGHPTVNIVNDSNRRVIFSYDHKLHIDKLFNSRGEPESYVFSYFGDPTPIIQHLKTQRLLFALRS